jgi:hypothetical protein
VSSWMSANFLSLNPSKTEFMLIGNSRQLSKLENTTLSLPNNVYVKPVSSARNLGVIFDSRLSFTDHVSSISKLATVTFETCAAFVLLLTNLLLLLLLLL